MPPFFPLREGVPGRGCLASIRVGTKKPGRSTAAGASVVAGLAAGQSLDVVAAARGVSIKTLRTQLETVFRKTRTDGQRELMRLIGALPQIR